MMTEEQFEGKTLLQRYEEDPAGVLQYNEYSGECDPGQRLDDERIAWIYSVLGNLSAEELHLFLDFVILNMIEEDAPWVSICDHPEQRVDPIAALEQLPATPPRFPTKIFWGVQRCSEPDSRFPTSFECRSGLCCCEIPEYSSASILEEQLRRMLASYATE